ncbi:lactonase family protein [Allokutzneria sp. A3M-2-11 16]|uniref:lactonase family protein n=1 Tax=Allokutzneria sp. A3M-2-11 16 TaxID=2962043 RepID=UPI0020B67F19|nr:lactonase family protein [Allokutzneria sp. A3M-2-11 16]MCP3805489.1 lactonase family protein [Allokutzneria sp. A3M-2-11 16]
MPASAFLDGKLRAGGRDTGGKPDTLTALDLPLQLGAPRDLAPPPSGEVAVENSVIGPPYGMVASKDGRFAYVLRTRGGPPPGVTEVKNVFTDLPRAAVVSVVDITDVRAPKVIQTVQVGQVAHTLSLSPDGSLLAVNTDEPGRNILIREVGPDGRIGTEVLAASAGEPGEAVRRVGRIEWHPSGRFLAHGIPFKDEIRFHEVVRTGGAVTLRPWGAPVKVGKFPDEGIFTPDGGYYLSTDLQWGDDVPGLFVDPPPGTITAVRFDSEKGKHKVTGRAPTDVSPEGIAVSPNGRYIVTGNLTHSWLPWNDKRLSKEGSMNLLELDKGSLKTLQRIPLNGVLPEGVTFDASGNHVAITVFDRFDPRQRRGAVEFFTLSQKRLERTNIELAVPPGPHSVWLVP